MQVFVECPVHLTFSSRPSSCLREKRPRAKRNTMNESPPNPPTPACLLCDAREARTIWTLTGQELRLIYEQTGRVLSERAYGAVTRETPIHLFECVTCGFQFFDPAL